MSKTQTTPADEGPSSPPTGAIPADIQAYIGRHLQAIYNEVVDEPVPDRFRQLLDELEKKTK